MSILDEFKRISYENDLIETEIEIESNREEGVSVDVMDGGGKFGLSLCINLREEEANEIGLNTFSHTRILTTIDEERGFGIALQATNSETDPKTLTTKHRNSGYDSSYDIFYDMNEDWPILLDTFFTNDYEIDTQNQSIIFFIKPQNILKFQGSKKGKFIDISEFINLNRISKKLVHFKCTAPLFNKEIMPKIRKNDGKVRNFKLKVSKETTSIKIINNDLAGIEEKNLMKIFNALKNNLSVSKNEIIVSGCFLEY